MGIVVENGGVLTTVQDEGRFGYQAYGVSTSGAMDSHAFHIANLLVGNEMTEGALEMTFIGPVLRFTQDNMIAITGGDLAPMLDGRPFPMYQAVLVKEGQKVKRGQQIAKMGSTDASSVGLHFEIRYRGQSVNPIKYLPK